MKIMLAIIGFIWLTSGRCGCVPNPKCDGKVYMHYTFDVPVSYSPNSDSLNLGDTLWIDNSFSEHFVNEDNGKTYHAPNIDFQATLSIVHLDGDKTAEYDLFNLIGGEGETKRIDYVRRYHQNSYISHAHRDGQYLYDIAFVPDKKGLYIVSINSSQYSYPLHDEQNVDITDCPDESLTTRYAANYKGDNNYELLKSAKDTMYANMSREAFDEGAYYCFYVK